MPPQRRNVDPEAISSESVPTRSQVRWHTPVKPALESLRQETSEFKASMGHTSYVHLHVYKIQTVDPCFSGLSMSPKKDMDLDLYSQVWAQDKDKELHSRSICRVSAVNLVLEGPWGRG